MKIPSLSFQIILYLFILDSLDNLDSLDITKIKIKKNKNK